MNNFEKTDSTKTASYSGWLLAKLAQGGSERYKRPAQAVFQWGKRNWKTFKVVPRKLEVLALTTLVEQPKWRLKLEFCTLEFRDGIRHDKALFTFWSFERNRNVSLLCCTVQTQTLFCKNKSVLVWSRDCTLKRELLSTLKRELNWFRTRSNTPTRILGNELRTVSISTESLECR